MILREILTKFGFKVESAPLEKYNGLVKNAISTMIGFKLAQIDVIGGVKDLITGMASLSKEIVYGAQRMGVSQENYQRLKEAAEESGAEVGDLMVGMRKLSMMMAGAANDEGKAAEKLEKFGFSAKDANGKLKSSEAVLYEVADKFKTMPNGVEKTNLAMSMFGKGGMALLPMLNKGSEGIKALGDEFAELGLVLDDEAIKSGRRYGRGLKDLRDIVDSFKLTISKALMPIVSDLIKKLNDWAIANKRIVDKRLSDALQGVVDLIKNIVSAIQSVISAVGGWDNAMKILKTTLLAIVAIKFVGVLDSILSSITGIVLTAGALPAKFAAGTAALNPLLLTVLAIAAAWLIAADAYGAYIGKNSLFRGMAQGIVKKELNAAQQAEMEAKSISSVPRTFGIKTGYIATDQNAYNSWLAKYQDAGLSTTELSEIYERAQKIRSAELRRRASSEYETIVQQCAYTGYVPQQYQTPANQNLMSIDNVTIKIDGSTNMSQDDIKKAVKEGMNDVAAEMNKLNGVETLAPVK